MKKQNLNRMSTPTTLFLAILVLGFSLSGDVSADEAKGAPASKSLHDPFDQFLNTSHSKWHVGKVTDLAFSDNGEFLVSGGEDKLVKVWSIPDLVHIANFSVTAVVDQVFISSDGELVAANAGSYISAWKTANAKQIFSGRASLVALSPSGNSLGLFKSNRVEVIDRSSGLQHAFGDALWQSGEVSVLHSWNNDLTFGPNEEFITLARSALPETSLRSDGFRVFDVDGGNLIARVHPDNFNLGPAHVSFATDGKEVVIADLMDLALVVDTSDWNARCSATPDGWLIGNGVLDSLRSFIVGSGDGEITLWSLEDCSFRGRLNRAKATAVASSESMLAVGDSSGEIEVIASSTLLDLQNRFSKYGQFAQRIESVARSGFSNDLESVLSDVIFHYHPGGNFSEYGDIASGGQSILELGQRIFTKDLFDSCEGFEIYPNARNVCAPENCGLDLNQVFSEYFELRWGGCGITISAAETIDNNLVIYGLRYF